MPLTPEGRASQSRHAKARRQFERAVPHSTGPRTAAGKRTAAMRGLQHGAYSEGAIALQRWLASVVRLAKIAG